MKRKNYILAILTVALLMFTGCDMRDLQDARVDMDKMNFAFSTHIFDFQMIIDGEIVSDASLQAWNVVHPLSPDFDAFYTELVFVHSMAEAQGFSDNIVVAWPRDEPITQIMLDRLNGMVNRTEEELRDRMLWRREPISHGDFGLTYPITVEDLVDNWEKVIAVWNALTESERMSLRP